MIDPSLIKHLPDSAQEELRLWESLFANRGWKQLEKLIDARFNMTKEVALAANTWEDNRKAVGALDTYKFIYNLPSILENEFTAMAEQAAEAEQEAVEDEELEYE
jgi:membrane-bound lytic murein transglycosylase MltF